MAGELAKSLIDAGVHFGHRTSHWNPKMKPYIFGRRNLIHIIDIKTTVRGMLLAKKLIAKIVAGGKDVLIVGTKRQARKTVKAQADRVGMHYVADRWLGGSLTNFREIRKRVSRLDYLEQLESDGMLDTYSKKEGSSLRREIRKILRNLGGVRKMETLPGVMVVIDEKREVNAIREAKKCDIPVICLLDTDSDPDMVDIAIPGNDDAMRSIELVVTELCNAVAEGLRATPKDTTEEKPSSQRRSSRATMGRAEDGMGEKSPAEAEPQSSQPPVTAEPKDVPVVPAVPAVAPAVEKPEPTSKT